MITSNERVIRLSEAVPGELVRIAIRDDVILGIVLAQDRRQTIVAALQPLPERTTYPFHFAPSSERQVITYGSNWYMEILRTPDFWVGSPSWRYASGALRLQGGDWFICVHPSPSDHQNSEFYYNLSTNEIVGGPGLEESAPISSWRIWQSESAYLNQLGEPLITVEAVNMT